MKKASIDLMEAFSQIACSSRGEALDIFGFWPFVAGDYIEVDRFAFVQRLESLALNRGMMDKHILSRLLHDESKPLLVIKPLYFTASHNEPFVD